MKANRFSPIHGTLVGITACLLSAFSLQAQTFTDPKNASAPPSQLEAAIYPLANLPSTIKVIFNNRAGGMVRVVIRDQTGKTFYDEFSSTTRYRRRFDLASLPEGNYTVELRKQNEQYAQSFAIESPDRSHIAMESQPIQITSDKPANKKLIVSQ